MTGNTFGKIFTITTYGESHGKSLGVIIDGMPSNIEIDEAKLQETLDARRPGRLKGTTSRDEKDIFEIHSGIFEGKTLGSPIMIQVLNKDQRSSDYDKIKNELRSHHADESTLLKYGIRDHRGGGRASGRETLARVIGGYFASLVLPKNLKIFSFINELGPFTSKVRPEALNSYSLPSVFSDQEVSNYLEQLKQDGNSVGGVITTIIENCPIGLGEPVFDKLKADLAKAVMSIGACVGFTLTENEIHKLDGKTYVSSKKNTGGLPGGISTGEDIVFKSYFKPTSTVSEKAKEGRHDPCILPRAIHVVNAMVYLTLADHYLRQKVYIK